MGAGCSTAYCPDYPAQDAGETLIVVWYPHRDAPSLIPWVTPSTADLPASCSLVAAELLLFRNRGRS